LCIAHQIRHTIGKEKQAPIFLFMRRLFMVNWLCYTPKVAMLPFFLAAALQWRIRATS